MKHPKSHKKHTHRESWQTEFATAVVDEFIIPSDTHHHYGEKERKAKIRELSAQVTQGTNAIREAVKLFSNYDKSGKFKILIERLKAVDREPWKLDESLLSDADFEMLYQLAYNTYEERHTRDAVQMLGYLTALFPNNIKSYLALASIEWIEEGPEKAWKFYEILLNVFQNPVLNVHAAHCCVTNKNVEQARLLLKEALKMCHEHHQYHPYLGEVNDALNNI